MKAAHEPESIKLTLDGEEHMFNTIDEYLAFLSARGLRTANILHMQILGPDGKPYPGAKVEADMSIPAVTYGVRPYFERK